MAKSKRAAREADALIANQRKQAVVYIYKRPSGYWYAQAYDEATGKQITDASGYGRGDVLAGLRGKFAMIGVDIKAIVDDSHLGKRA